MKKREKLRDAKIFRSRKVNLVITALFPLFLFFITELGAMQSFNAFFSFFWSNPGILFFDLILLYAFYASVAFFAGKLWISALVVGFIFEGFSVVEYYKFKISNSHFTLPDLAVTANPGDVAQFTTLTFNVIIFCAVLLFAAYVVFIYGTEISVRLKLYRRISIGAVMFALLTVFLLWEQVFCPVANAFGVDSSTTYNSFSDTERYNSNSYNANMFVSLNQLVRTYVTEPDDYDEDKVGEYLENNDQVSASDETPNVIFVLCESFADFRSIAGDYVEDGIYDAFDETLEKSFSATAVVPTFGGNTVRSEFEMIMGLPVKSLNNSATPHKLVDTDEEIESIPSLMKKIGYNTFYMHPFSSSFYAREDYYPLFGFDNLIFQEDFPDYDEDGYVTPETSAGGDIFETTSSQALQELPGYTHGYISDSSLYEEILDTMEKTNGSDFIFAMTMQNHQPYNKTGTTEFSEYLSLVKASGEALRDLVNSLDEFDEPTVLVFMGDHFPFFGSENNIYDILGYNSNNCSALYLQKYIIYSNYELDVDINTTVSAFYLPTLVLDSIGIENSFISTMTSLSSKFPIYSYAFGENKNSELDIITYDRVLGEHYSIATSPESEPTED